MAIIYTYGYDSNINGADALIGTDSTGRKTKQFKVSDLTDYISDNISVVAGVNTITTTDSTFISLTPSTPQNGDVIITSTLSASGTADETTYLRGDNTWATIPSSEDNYVDSISFNTGTGDLTLGRTGVLPDLVQSLDGRYALTGSGITGSGTVNYVSKWAGATALGDSIIYDSGSAVGIGTTSLGTRKLRVTGAISASRVYFRDSSTDPSFYIEYGSGDRLNYVAFNNHRFITGSSTVVTTMQQNGQLTLNRYGTGTFVDTPVYNLGIDGSGNVIETPIALAPVDGSGTANYITKWSDVDTITDSIMYDNGTSVGIGTPSPANKLDVTSNLAGAGGISVTNTNTGSTATSSVIVTNGAAGRGGAFNYIPPTYTAFPVLTNYLDLVAYSQTSGFIIRTSGNGNIKFLQGGITAANERFTINSSNVTVNTGLSNVDFIVKGTSGDILVVDASASRVGIGTVSPSQKLHVDGNARLTGAFYDSNNSAGAVGQVLTSTSTSTEWTDPGSITQVPVPITAFAGGSLALAATVNFVYFSWLGGSGTYTLNLPSAVTYPYKVIRFVTDGGTSASNKIHIQGSLGQTVDGGTFYPLDKAYNGVQVWSDGSEWIVIQAKAT